MTHSSQVSIRVFGRNRHRARLLNTSMISKDEKQAEQKGIVSQNHEEDDVEEDDVVDDTPGAGGEPGEGDLETVVICYSEETKKKKKKKKPKKKKAQQSDPPRVGLSKIFTNGIYPEGEIQPYKDECVLQQVIL